MKKLPLALSVLGILACGSAAHAAHLTCTGTSGAPNTDLVGFAFETKIAVSTGGGGGTSGKPTSSLTVQLPLNSTFGPIYQIANEGKHLSSCVLTKVVNSSTTITITMDDVLFSDVQLLSGPPVPYGSPSPLFQLTLAFGSISTQATP